MSSNLLPTNKYASTDMLLCGRHAGEVPDLVWQLLLMFAMKDLGPTIHILGMKISRPRNRTQFFLSQANYIERALEHFNMESTKFAFIPLLSSLWLSQKNCSTSSPKGEIIKSVPYAPTINSLVYTTVATRLDLAHAIRVISRFMHNFDQSH